MYVKNIPVYMSMSHICSSVLVHAFSVYVYAHMSECVCSLLCAEFWSNHCV